MKNMRISEEEKNALVEQFRKMLDSGDDASIVYETVEVPEPVVDPFLEGKIWPEPFRRRIHRITLKTYER